MPNPTATSVHVDRPLTEISVAFMQRATQFIADKVFPNVSVDKQSNRYFVYDRRDWQRMEARLRAPGSETAGGGWRIDNTPTYYAAVRGVHKDVDEQIAANADAPIDLVRDATSWVTQQCMLAREVEWASKYFTTGVWGTDLQGVAGVPVPPDFQQWNESASDPIGDITGQVVAIASATGYKPNKLVISPSVFRALKNHPDVLDRIKYTMTGVVTEQLLAQLFDLDQVLVAWAVRDTSVELAAADATDFILGNNALLVYAAPSPSILAPSAGYIFSWQGLPGAGAFGNRISRFDMPHLRAERIECELAFDAKVVSADLGTFFADAVA